MKMSERIAHAITHSGKQPRDLAKEIGITVARISQLKSESGGIKAEHLFAFARATGFSAQWIGEGVGEQRLASGTDQYVIIPNYPSGGSHNLDGRALNAGLVFRKEWLRQQGLVEENLHTLLIQGKSMEPSLNEGSLALLDSSQTLPIDRAVFGIIQPSGEMVLKRLVRSLIHGWLVLSDNPDKRSYPDEIASDSDVADFRIAGRIIWSGGRL